MKIELMDFERLEGIVEKEDAMRVDLETRAHDLQIRVTPRKTKGNQLHLVLGKKIAGEGASALGSMAVKFTSWGLKSLLGKRLGLPVDFMVKDLPSHFTQDIIDHYLQSGPDRAYRLRVRMGDGEPRVLGVMPCTLPRFTNSDMLDAVRPLVLDGGMKVLRYTINDFGMSMYLVFSRRDSVTIGAKKDYHRFGIWVTHSDVGFRVPQIDFAVIRETCSNGAIGLTGDPLIKISRSALHNISTFAVSERLHRSVRQAMYLRQEYLSVLRNAHGAETKEASAIDEIVRLMKKNKIPARYLGFLEDAYRQEFDVSPDSRGDRWSVAQAFTRAAQGMDAELGERFERLAWSYLQERARAS
jgi:hypothetical protein